MSLAGLDEQELADMLLVPNTSCYCVNLQLNLSTTDTKKGGVKCPYNRRVQIKGNMDIKHFLKKNIYCPLVHLAI